MKPLGRATDQHFQQEVADFLKLPPDAGDAEVRQALRAKGPDFLFWYDTRLRAIAESKQAAHRLQQTHRTTRLKRHN